MGCLYWSNPRGFYLLVSPHPIPHFISPPDIMAYSKELIGSVIGFSNNSYRCCESIEEGRQALDAFMANRTTAPRPVPLERDCGSTQSIDDSWWCCHWGQGPVFQASTSQVHCKEMDKVPCMYPPSTSQVHSEFPLPVFLQFPWPGECPVHSQCPGSHDCDIPINYIMGTS